VLEARARGGTGVAEFTLALDKAPVDVNGKVGADAAFTSLSLDVGKKLRITIAAPPPGRHELRLRYAAHGHDARRDVVVRFTVAAPPSVTPSAAASPTPSTAVGSAFTTERPDTEPAAAEESPASWRAVLALLLAVACIGYAAMLSRRARRERTRPADLTPPTPPQ
jgi:hypothetical protein